MHESMMYNIYIMDLCIMDTCTMDTYLLYKGNIGQMADIPEICCIRNLQWLRYLEHAMVRLLVFIYVIFEADTVGNVCGAGVSGNSRFP